MAALRLDDLDDPRLDVYRQVKATNRTRGLGLFVLEGEKLLRRLLASRYETASVLVTDRVVERVGPLVPEGVPVYVIPHEWISELAGYHFHLGVMSAGVRAEMPDLEATIRGASGRMTVAVCPHIDNPENLGAIVRISDVFGVLGVLAGEKCPDPLSRRVLRVSMGTSLRVPVWACADLDSIVETLRNDHGFLLAASVCHDEAATAIGDYERPQRLALLLGNEAHGLDAEWVRRCDHRLTIPMRAGAESLNVAVAAGFCFIN